MKIDLKRWRLFLVNAIVCVIAFFVSAIGPKSANDSNFPANAIPFLKSIDYSIYAIAYFSLFGLVFSLSVAAIVFLFRSRDRLPLCATFLLGFIAFYLLIFFSYTQSSPTAP
jgi:hypothetical protein